MHLAEHHEKSGQSRRGLADVDEAHELVCSGEVREALKILMRGMPEEFGRSGSKAGASRRLSVVLTALCYILMGMYGDALEWCAADERGESRDPIVDHHGAQSCCLQLWCLVVEGDLRGAMPLCIDLLAQRELPDEIFFSGVAAMMLLAMKLEDHALARELASLVPEQGTAALAHIGAALIEVCRVELGFRELLHAMPEFRGSVGCSQEQAAGTLVFDRLQFARRAESLAAKMAVLETRLRTWSLLQELVLTMRLATEILALQFLGRAVDLSSLEMRVGSFNARGLVPLCRHGRFLLAVINLHQGRPATANSWLATGRPSELETREHLLAANVRVHANDWPQAFDLYRHYVQSAAAHGRIAGELRARLTAALGSPSRPIGSGAMAQRPQGLARETIQANESRFVAQVDTSRSLALGPNRGTKTADAVRNLIEEDLGQPLLVREIAARLGIARRTVENRVRLESGHSVKRFVTGLRLEHAYRLVQESAPVNAHTLQAIAAQVGFTSYRTFCAAYTKSFGRIPHRRGRP